MIFLAVSLGFLAESLREGIGDREKEVRKSLYYYSAIWVGRFYMFGTQDATMMQLKNGVVSG